MAINKEHWLYSLDIIKNSKVLRADFEKTSGIPFNYDLIKASFNGGLLKDTIFSQVENVGAICFEINGKIFLQGETKSGFDFIGDQCGDHDLIELFDMTTEMESGHSYSFYTSTTSYFMLARLEECIKVNEFLKTLP